MSKVAVMTDLGNVLVTFWERVELIQRIIIPFGGDPKSLEFLFPKAKGGSGESVYELLDTGELPLQEFWQKLCQNCGIDPKQLPYPMFFALFSRHLQPIEPVVNLFYDLQERFPIIAVSNGDEGSRYAVHMLEVFYNLRFEKVFVSHEQRCRKPALLNHVREWLIKNKFDPAQCPFVDDLPRYTEAARIEYGFPAILFDATRQPVSLLQSELAKFGIK